MYNLEYELTMWEAEQWNKYHKDELEEIKIPEVDTKPISEEEIRGMWEATPEEQDEIDDILADFGLDLE